MATPNDRFLSIDVLRGITIASMIIVNTPGSWSHVYSPLLHSKWHGCTVTDLVFPFFLFVVGLSMAFSFAQYDGNNTSQWVAKALKRTVLILLIGILLNWFPFFHQNISNLRIFGVLQRIALAFGGAAILIIFLKKQRLLVLASTFILFGYWALMYFGGVGIDPYSLETNLATQFDVGLAGKNHVYNGFGIPFDPEGFISSIPCIAHVIIGYLIGNVTRKYTSNKKRLIYQLCKYSILLIIGGLLWNTLFPINKPLWTSSYVLYTLGIGTLLYSILIWILDIKKVTRWAFPFKAFGLNPLASYILSGLFVKVSMHILNWEGGNPYSWAYSNIFEHIISPKFGSLLQALLYTFFIWIFAYVLFKMNKVIKL